MIVTLPTLRNAIPAPTSPFHENPPLAVQHHPQGPVRRSIAAHNADPGPSNARSIATTLPRRSADALDITDIPPTPITHLSETEALMADSVSKFANEVILPKVREMDEEEKMDPAVVEQCFEQGLMGIEIPEEYGGAGMNFTAGIVAIEELARVDPSVSVMVDVHNTLVNTAILKYGSLESQKKWLPKLATGTVGESRSFRWDAAALVKLTADARLLLSV